MLVNSYVHIGIQKWSCLLGVVEPWSCLLGVVELLLLCGSSSSLDPGLPCGSSSSLDPGLPCGSSSSLDPGLPWILVFFVDLLLKKLISQGRGNPCSIFFFGFVLI